MNISEILTQFDQIRIARRKLDDDEKRLKRRIHTYMNTHNVNTIVSDNFVCTRSIATRSSMKKMDTPLSIWNKYAKDVEYATLKVTPTGRFILANDESAE